MWFDEKCSRKGYFKGKTHDYFVKHRRLKRSFQEFASRYSPAGGGAAAIFNHNLLGDPNADDDDTNPIIRGFSDNEPLVVS